MSYKISTSDTIANEALRAEVARLSRVLGQYEQAEEKRKNDAMLERVNAQEQAEQAKVSEAQAAKLALERVNVPRPDSLKAYSNLDWKLKSRLIDAFGSDFPAEIAAKERSGLSWEAYDKLRAEANNS